MDVFENKKTCVFCEEIISANEITKHIAANHFNIVFKHLIERLQEESNEKLIQEQIDTIESKVKELQIQENQKTFDSTEGKENGKKVSCLKCEKRFRTKSCLLQHDQHVHQKIRYPCKTCSKTFASKQMMKRHLSKHHNCHEGNSNQLGQKILESREENENTQKVSCLKCEKRFRTKRCLLQHDRMVHQKIRFHCQKCLKTFASKQMMKLHLSKHRKANSNQLEQKEEKVDSIKKSTDSKGPKHTKYSCDQCDKTYKRREHLQRHTTSQHTSTRHTCDQCGKQFKRKEHLKRHTITEHTNARYVCNQCGLQFKRTESLKEHQKKNCNIFKQ